MLNAPFHPFPVQPDTPVTAAILSGAIEADSESCVVSATVLDHGSTTCGTLALTSWEGSGARGLQLFVRDLDRGLCWPAGRAAGTDFQPPQTRWEPGDFRVEQSGGGLRVRTETCVLPGVAVQLLRITIHNLEPRARRLDVTSLAEVVLNDRAAHAAHPAFSKLFLQTSYDAELRTLSVRRRPRSPHERTPLLIHSLLEPGATEFETDRARFFGRCRSPWNLRALTSTEPLAGVAGNVLDPVVALRRAVDLAPESATSLTFLLGTVAGPDSIQERLGSLAAPGAIERAFVDARAGAKRRMTRVGATTDQQRLAEELAAAILRHDPNLRARSFEPGPVAGDPQRLVRLGIDRSRPLVVAESDPTTTRLLETLWRTWRSLGLSIQLVTLGEEAPESETTAPCRFHLAATDLDESDRVLLRLAADLYLDDAGRLEAIRLPGPALHAPVAVAPSPSGAAPIPDESLEYANGWGGFDRDGREYVIDVPASGTGARVPPRPWTNVMANDRFGCLVSETGAATTWYGNSREHRLTPWANDPLLDPHGEALLLRDETDASVFSCQPGPLPGGGVYRVRHGQGYSRWERRGDDLDVATLTFVDRRRPVRLTRVRVANLSGQPRRLSLFAVHRLVLGGSTVADGRFVATEIDRDSGALLARSLQTGPFADAVAFAAVLPDSTGIPIHHTGDGAAFAGPTDDAIRGLPAAPELDGRTGVGLDPCLALQACFDLAPGQSREFWVLLGMEEDRTRAVELIRSLAGVGACEEAWNTTRDSWRSELDRIGIRTPARELDLMVNGWLGYQTLACRLQGRTALYQSGGAYGFRDQLQDALSLLPLWPGLVREQILLHAGHQFVEGDVLHWWHPPLDRGIRTRFADDLLWLPLAVAEYVRATADRAILDEDAPYLTARELEPGQDEVFLQAQPSGEAGSLYEHCCRALDRSLVRGVHGLPLFGTGDWNDGMNRVGREGRGESVWMGFFLVEIIDGFLPLCLERGENDRAARYRRYRDEMVHTLNDAGWDGDWYRRGYYDDGSPLGSWENKECAIDALAQSWSVLSGAAPPRRANQAMDAVRRHLIDEENGLIRLLTPPFVDTPHDPGYIKGYVAGVRENGGQYTHAALWAVRAMAELGRRNEAAGLLAMLTPVRHARDAAAAARYQVEPYVVAADVYGADPHVGRGGWSWYTGSSGWMLRVAIESILGLRAEGSELVVAPCIPDDWPGYSLTWKVPALRAVPGVATDGADAARYEIEVVNPELCSAAVVAIEWDGQERTPVDGSARLPLVRDGRDHRVRITLGPEEST